MSLHLISALIGAGFLILIFIRRMYLETRTLKDNVYTLLKTGRALSRKRRNLLAGNPDELLKQLASISDDQYRALKIYIKRQVEDDIIPSTFNIAIGTISLLIAILASALSLQSMMRSLSIEASNEAAKDKPPQAGADAIQNEVKDILFASELLQFSLIIVITLFVMTTVYILARRRQRKFIRLFSVVMEEFEKKAR